MNNIYRLFLLNLQPMFLEEPNVEFFEGKDTEKAEKIISSDKTKLLFDFALSASALRDIDSVLEKTAYFFCKILNCDRSSIFIWDKKKKKLWSKVALGLDETIELEPDKGIVGFVFSQKQPIIINDPYSDHRFNPEIDRKTGYKTKNIIAVPLITYLGNIVGVIEGINKLEGEFDGEDLKFAQILSTYAANSIENALLYSEIKKTQEEIVVRLSIAAEFRDKTTYNHLVRMSIYSYLIAREMGFDEDWCEKLRLAAPMHDIGKLGVPDRILLKPSKLTDEEFKEMQKHTIYGYDILKDSDIDILKMGANIALCHHERYDGKGYPKGLKGEEIPIEARIVALADVVDALLSRRPYKEPFGIDEVVDFVKKESGKHFDPKVVSAFLRIIPQIKKVLEKYGVD